MAGTTDMERQELLTLARDGSQDGRSRLVQAVGDLYFENGQPHGVRERDLMTDIMRQLIFDVEKSVRKALANRLAEEHDAPSILVNILANDEIDVAHNILKNSPVLQDLELMEIIRQHTEEHHNVIAMRAGVSETVSDALVETGNTQVIKTLIGNKTAQVSETTLNFLVDESESQEDYRQPLLERPDMSPHLAKRMYWWVSAALRQHIVEEYDVDPGELDRTMQGAIKGILGEEEETEFADDLDGGPNASSGSLAEQLAAGHDFTPETMIRMLQKGDVKTFETMFAQAAGLRVTLVRRMIYEPGGEGMAIASRAMGMSKSDFGSLFLLSRSMKAGDQSVDRAEATRVMTFFDRIRENTAKKVVSRWKLDPNYLFAIKQVEGERKTVIAQ